MNLPVFEWPIRSRPSAFHWTGPLESTDFSVRRSETTIACRSIKVLREDVFGNGIAWRVNRLHAPVVGPLATPE